MKVSMEIGVTEFPTHRNESENLESSFKSLLCDISIWRPQNYESKYPATLEWDHFSEAELSELIPIHEQKYFRRYIYAD